MEPPSKRLRFESWSAECSADLRPYELLLCGQSKQCGWAGTLGLPAAIDSKRDTECRSYGPPGKRRRVAAAIVLGSPKHGRLGIARPRVNDGGPDHGRIARHRLCFPDIGNQSGGRTISGFPESGTSARFGRWNCLWRFL